MCSILEKIKRECVNKSIEQKRKKCKREKEDKTISIFFTSIPFFVQSFEDDKNILLRKKRKKTGKV